MKISVILYNLRSLYNVGSIFRTADAAGVEKIYLAGFTPAPLDVFKKPRPRMLKVSLGAEKSVPWKKISQSSTVKLLKDLKTKGYKILAIEQNKKSLPYYKIHKIKDFKKIALVMGNEIKGLPSSVLVQADKILEIPMLGRKESLNVSIAFAIVVYRLLFK